MLNLLLVEVRISAGHRASGRGIDAVAQGVGLLSDHRPGYGKPVAA